MSDKLQTFFETWERLDNEFRENGLSDFYKEKWGVQNNVGVWICGREAGQKLYDLIVAAKPTSILELGTSIGYSTAWLASAANEVGGHVTSIEKASYKVIEAREAMKDLGFENVQIIEGDIAQQLEGWVAPIDFVFMDANKAGYLPQFQQLEPHLTVGAFVVADNVSDMKDRVQDFLDYVQQHDGFETSILDVGHGLAVIKKL